MVEENLKPLQKQEITQRLVLMIHLSYDVIFPYEKMKFLNPVEQKNIEIVCVLLTKQNWKSWFMEHYYPFQKTDLFQ